VKVTFEYEKATKNTLRFSETKNDLGPAPAIGTLYVQKWAVKQLLSASADANQQEVTLTVEVSLA